MRGEAVGPARDLLGGAAGEAEREPGHEGGLAVRLVDAPPVVGETPENVVGGRRAEVNRPGAVRWCEVEVHALNPDIRWRLVPPPDVSRETVTWGVRPR